MVKIDPYKNEERWEAFKQNHYKKVPKGIRKEDWKLLIEFLKDMELGLNTPTGKNGKRSPGTLLNLSSHNKVFLENFKKPIPKLEKIDLHNLEKDVVDGKILARGNKKYGAFGNYIKDFKVFWHWLQRTGKVKEDITMDISSKTDKPAWVYLTEKEIKRFFNKMAFDYRVYCFFLLDTGSRVTEAINVQIKDFNKDFTQVTLREESAKTFERTINLKLCSGLVKEFVEDNDLKPDDRLFQKFPIIINRYLKHNCGKMFGADKISNPKAKGKYGEFTMYDIRHNSACFWFNKYPTHKGLMYRFGWRNPEKIEYYSNFLGVADEITDSDMVMGEDRTKLIKLEEDLKQQGKKIESQDKTIAKLVRKLEQSLDLLESK